MITEWDCPFQIESVYGTLDLNAASGDRYLLDHEECDAGADLRFTADNIPSADGGITHNVYASWYAVKLVVQLWEDNDPACGEALNRMTQTISKHLFGMRRADGRLWFTPTGYAERLLDNLRVSSRPTAAVVSDVLTTLTFGLVSPFPYAISATEACEHVNDGDTFTFTNDGSVDFYPVIHVDGDSPSIQTFQISNVTTGYSLSYDGTRPGAIGIVAGKQIEFDFFRNTAYLGDAGTCGSPGGPYDGANMKPGIDIVTSDFFPFAPGDNDVTITGTGMDVLYHDAFG